MLFWDMIAGVYDLFEKLYNGKCYDETGARVAQEINKNDIVLDKAVTRLIQGIPQKDLISGLFANGRPMRSYFYALLPVR